MKYANQCAVIRFALIAIVSLMLTMSLPAGAGEIHGKQTTQNLSFGQGALSNLTTGNYNTAIGITALQKNSEGQLNTATGVGALARNTTGSANTATGGGALTKNTTGVSNIATGSGALQKNTTGSNNTAVGTMAGHSNTTGNGNVFIGYKAGNNLAYQSQSNKLVIATGPESTNELILGDFVAHKVYINGNLYATGSLTQNSDGRLKKDIQPLTHALDSILQLQGKIYRWKEGTTFANKKDIGLVAQEVEEIFPELVAKDERGYKGIAYSKLTAVLIEAMKEQQGQMITQQAQITALEKENTQLKTIMAEQMDALLARVAMLEGVSLAAN